METELTRHLQAGRLSVSEQRETEMSIVVGLIIAIVLLLIIAFPERLLPDDGQRRKRIGATYWGFYAGSPISEADAEETIESVTIIKKDGVIAGSTSYALGRGVNSGG